MGTESEDKHRDRAASTWPLRTLLVLPLALCLLAGLLLATLLPLGRAADSLPGRAAGLLEPWEAHLAATVAGEFTAARDRLARLADWTRTGALDLRAPHSAHALLGPLLNDLPASATVTLYHAGEALYTLQANGGGTLLRLAEGQPFGARLLSWHDDGRPAGAPPLPAPPAALRDALEIAGLDPADAPWSWRVDPASPDLDCRGVHHFPGPDGAPCAASIAWALPVSQLVDFGASPMPEILLYVGSHERTLTAFGYGETLLHSIHPHALERAAQDGPGRPLPLTVLDGEYWTLGRWLAIPNAPELWVAAAIADRAILRWDLRQALAALPGMLLTLVGGLGIVLFFTRRWARLSRIVAAKAEAVEREGVAPAYWPRTRVREFRQVQRGVDVLARVARRGAPGAPAPEVPADAPPTADTMPAPLPAPGAQELAPPPQAYVQALQSTRRQLRELQAEVEELYLELQEAGARDQALRDRLERQRAVLVEAGADNALLEGGAQEALEAIAASAAKALGLARVSLWRYTIDANRLHGVLRYDRLNRRADAAPNLNRDALPVLFLALDSDPVIATRDLPADARLRELAPLLPGTPPTGALVAVVLRRAGLPVALCAFEHAGGERHWETDEVNFLAGMAYLCLPRLAAAEPAALPAPEAMADLVLPAPDPEAETHRQLVEQTTGMMWLLDHEGRFRYVNPAAAAAYGWPPEQMTGRFVSEFTATGFAQLERLALRAVRDGQPRYAYLTEHLRANGESLTLAVNLSPVRAADGTITGYVALAADTTDAHRPPGRAKPDPETHFRTLVEGSPELIFELDRIGCVRSVNPAVARVYGHDPAALLGQPISMLTDAAQAQRDLDRLTAILDGAECTAYETSHIRKDATRVRLLVVAEPQHDGDGRVSGIIGAAIELAPDEVASLATGGNPADN